MYVYSFLNAMYVYRLLMLCMCIGFMLCMCIAFLNAMYVYRFMLCMCIGFLCYVFV